MSPPPARPLFVMLVAVLAMSWAAPLIRLATAPPLAVASWRLTIATALLLPFVLAIAGAAIIAGGDLRGGTRAQLAGDLLALAGAAFGGLYFVIGRRLRGTLSLAAYVTPVYGVSALVLLAWAALRGEAFVQYPSGDWAIFAGLALGPMLIGHTGLNYALRYLPAYSVNVAALGEPVGATLIAWFLPAIAQRPPLAAVFGGVLALGGIALALADAPGRSRD